MERHIEKFGDNAVLFRWPEVIDEEIHRELLSLDRFLQNEYPNEILETVVTYNSVAAFLSEDIKADSFLGRFAWPQLEDTVQPATTTTYIVPVCYEPHFALDLQKLAEHCELEPDQVIQLHTSVTYEVRFIGFLPGFPYLSGLDRRLYTPRISEPRKLIEKGSVGIGGKQTGIYTMNSPGGWNIIGKSPLNFFNVNEEQPSVFQPGDRLVFKSISIQEYDEINRLVAQGNYEIQKLK